MLNALKAGVFFALLLIFMAGIYFKTYNIELSKEGIGGIPNYQATNLIMVYLSGEVNKPGVYEISKDLSLFELIELAGGFTSNADSNFISSEINLSKKLDDRAQIFIPSTSTTTATGSKSNSNKININSATLEQLTTLPGIGEATAKKIIEARPFKEISNLLDIKGIGDSKFNAIKELIAI